MRGQYFSFDAIIATVIMVIAVTSLISYWWGAQSVMESRTGSMYADSLRVAESLLSPGVPADWESAPDLSNVRQLGIASGYSNELNRTKIEQLQRYANPLVAGSNYDSAGKIMRAAGEYYIVIEQADNDSVVQPFLIGKPYPDNSSYVVVAHRGGTLEGHPMRISVYLWRQ